MYYLISILLGVLPDILYYYLTLKAIKGFKDKKLLFFILLFVFYLLSNIFVAYNFYIYLIFDILVYFAIKILYRSKINDFFLILSVDLYLFLCSTATYFILGNYLMAFIVYRILLFIPLIFRKRLKRIYSDYSSLWNRHNEVGKIKSITLRNISLVLLNTMIILFYLVLSYIVNGG